MHGQAGTQTGVHTPLNVICVSCLKKACHRQDELLLKRDQWYSCQRKQQTGCGVGSIVCAGSSQTLCVALRSRCSSSCSGVILTLLLQLLPQGGAGLPMQAVAGGESEVIVKQRCSLGR